MHPGKIAIPLALLTASLFSASPARAWGCKGHETVALIAEKHLSPEAKELVLTLLKENPVDPSLKRYCGSAVNDPMGDAATWADDVRNERHNGPWHYIDIPRGTVRPADGGNLAPYCGDAGCVTEALAAQIAILKDKSADSTKRAEALRYIIHFVGDLHQPLHSTTNDDEGGNCLPLKYFRRKPREHNHGFSPNLHNVWDSAILERDAEGADSHEYADRLDETYASSIEQWQKAGIHIEDWVWESHAYAEKNVYDALTPKVAIEKPTPVHACTDDNNIGARLLDEHITVAEPYQDQAAPIVERQLTIAGIRLAAILNASAIGAN
jgi:S1/P1 Nuclease